MSGRECLQLMCVHLYCTIQNSLVRCRLAYSACGISCFCSLLVWYIRAKKAWVRGFIPRLRWEWQYGYIVRSNCDSQEPCPRVYRISDSDARIYSWRRWVSAKS
jgi:hypothetical protein